MHSMVGQERLFLLGGWLLFQIPSLRILFKYVPNEFHLISMLCMGGITLLGMMLLQPPLSSKLYIVLKRPWLGIVVLVIATSIIFFVYPMADGLKQVMRGSDQDDCIISPIMALLKGHSPYLERSYLGNPCSPGPGLLLVYLPFVSLKLYPFGMIAGLAVLAVVLRWLESQWVTANIMILLFFSSLFSWELAVVGSDLPMVGCVIALTALLLEKAWRDKQLGILLLASILAGLAASSRINLIYLPLLLTVYLFLKWPKGAFFFFIVSFLVAIVPGLIIYLADPYHFTPFHLITKGTTIISPTGLLIGACISLLTACLGFIHLWQNPNASLSPILLLCMMPSLLFVAFGELAQRNYSIAAWEGANYLMPMLPLTALVMARFSSRFSDNLQ